MRNKFLIGFIFFAVLAAQFACNPIRQMELERNRVLWRWNKIENYKMTIKIQKTGHAAPNGKFIITVRDRVAKSIQPIDKPDVEMLDTQIKFGGYGTIEGIFRYIENVEIARASSFKSWDRWKIEYDSELGYPKNVDLDQSGVFDDELSFEVLEFEAAESSDSEPAENSSPPGFITVPASEITKVEFSTKSHYGPLVGTDESYTASSAMSFSNDGTALKSFGAKSYDTGKTQNAEAQKYQGVVSGEQFQNLARSLADKDFSNLKDPSENLTDMAHTTLTITYSGKSKTILLSSIGNDSADIKKILAAFEALRDHVDWKEIK